MIRPVDLPETALIIGGNFPAQDEDAYAREADGQRVAARQAEGAGDTAHSAAGYTETEFLGGAGRALAVKMKADGKRLVSAGARHNNVAGWFDLGAENIADTKAAMNEVSERYHAAYEALRSKAQEETWAQHALRRAKDELVITAQRQVHLLRTEFETNHAAISSGISEGGAAVRPPGMHGGGDTPVNR